MMRTPNDSMNDKLYQALVEFLAKRHLKLDTRAVCQLIIPVEDGENLNVPTLLLELYR